MYFFRYHVECASNHPNIETLAGGVANIIVDASEPVAAESRAREYLSNHRWNIVSPDEIGAVKDRGDFEHDELLVTLHDRAKEFGVSCLMAAYPTKGTVLPEVRIEPEPLAQQRKAKEQML